jgi:hypothetical protein
MFTQMSRSPLSRNSVLLYPTGMRTESHPPPSPTISRPGDLAAIKGIDSAIELARCGRLISAIKEIERANPSLSRERAKAIVRALGYGRDARWPEPDRQPQRVL